MNDTYRALEERVSLQALLGYLNFSEGKADLRFQKQLNDAYAFLAERGVADPWPVLNDLLRQALGRLQTEGASAFQNVGQAEAVLALVFARLLPAYREFHADLLFHQTERDLFQPFFVARAFEAVLPQGPPWEEDKRIVAAALQRLNDFVGHRPIAILETRPRGEPYDHERLRPIPLFLRGAGVAYGRYQRLISQALDILAATAPEILADASFDPALLEELALDPRAYDHGHPVNRRPNYVFGEWDPHHIDNQGRYRRYVVRQVTLDALLARVQHPGDLPPEEALFEAAAVLAGTILMATGISGAGPEAHDSSVTLANLMPRIARYRDAFYGQLLSRVSGSHSARLRQEETLTRQPFGGARQHLNHFLARHRATLLQQRHLALLMADMGYPEASRRQAALIPAASVRLLSEIHIRLASGQIQTEQGRLDEAARLVSEVEDLLRRGIACGALADPWNILGFQGQFPLSAALQDSVRDQRIDELLAVVEQLLNLYAHLLSEAAGHGKPELVATLRKDMKHLASWWDRFASVEVSDVRRVHGGEATASAKHVARALAHWRERGQAAADLAFWRQHLQSFQSPKAFALVVDALLRKNDYQAAMALLINWLGQVEQVPLAEGDYSFHALAVRWMLGVSTQGLPIPEAEAPAPPEFSVSQADLFALKKKFLDYLEANAEEYWQLPAPGEAEELPMPEEEEDVYGAAYEDVTYRDSTGDDEEGEVIEGGPDDDFDLEEEGEELLKRLQFLGTVARLWQIAAWRHPQLAALQQEDPARQEALRSWLKQARTNQQAVAYVLDGLHEYPIPEPSGDHESLVEFDRRRQLKEQLLSAAIATSLDMTMAVGTLEGALQSAPDPALAPTMGMAAWHPVAIELERALFRGDAARVRALLPEFVPLFRQEPLLFQPLADGGHPRHIVQAVLAQNVLRGLLSNLPRLGLLRETYHLLRLARDMGNNVAPEAAHAGRRVSVFDHLYQIAFQSVVETVVDALAAWETVPLEQTYSNVLNPLVEPFAKLWSEQITGIQLSPLDPLLADERQWTALRLFIQRYGSDLFQARFMTLGNLRGILHRGPGAYLNYLADNPDPLHPVRLLDDLDRVIPRRQAEWFLHCILAAVVDNYEEYKDYNATTSQSDYGENLGLLLDFLRVLARYERDAWRVQPLLLVHEVLVRKQKWALAIRLQEELTHKTEEFAGQHLEILADLEKKHGMCLRTVRDRLEERFVKPMALDRLCALVEPAMDEARRQKGFPAFAQFEAELQPYAAEPTGVGLDVPHWLRRLSFEVQRIYAARTAIAGLAVQLVQVPRTVLSYPEFQEQLQNWETPPGGM